MSSSLKEKIEKMDGVRVIKIERWSSYDGESDTKYETYYIRQTGENHEYIYEFTPQGWETKYEPEDDGWGNIIEGGKEVPYTSKAGVPKLVTYVKWKEEEFSCKHNEKYFGCVEFHEMEDLSEILKTNMRDGVKGYSDGEIDGFLNALNLIIEKAKSISKTQQRMGLDKIRLWAIDLRDSVVETKQIPKKLDYDHPYGYVI